MFFKRYLIFVEMVSYKGFLLTLGQTRQFYAEIVVVLRYPLQIKRIHRTDTLGLVLYSSNCYVLIGLDAVNNVPSQQRFFFVHLTLSVLVLHIMPNANNISIRRNLGFLSNAVA